MADDEEFRNYRGYPLRDSKMDDYGPEEEWPIEQTVTYRPIKLAVIEQDALSSLAIQMPDDYEGPTVRGRQHRGPEIPWVAVLIEGAWYRHTIDIYWTRRTGETDADVVERLGISEESLIPGRHRHD